MSHAIVMAGGGAAAAFQVGVLMSMHNNRIPIHSVYGTSAGALNAAGYAYAGPNELYRMWSSMTSWRDLWSINTATLVGRGSGLLNSKPLRKKIDKFCKGREAACRCCVTKVDMTNGDLVYSYAGDWNFRESVEASAALPGIISPIRNRFSDGGIREVLPLKKAIDEGHDHITVILCHPWSRAVENWKVNEGFLGFLSTALRADSIRSNEVLKDDINTAINLNADPSKRKIDITIYAPNTEILDCLDFVPEKIDEAIAAGVKARPTEYNALR
jgi:NTE family protein